jgi:ATP-dependent HslUV protease ATP-binding subunit HslU
LKELTPREIVKELDTYIVGQQEAKRCVAIALRNRWRRQQVPPELRDEVAPKNIIMIGPTGVGKTEIARRLASLVKAPFLKVEATKYTEIGYHGRDVESIVRDLVEISVGMVRQQHTKMVEEKAKNAVEEKLLDLLLPPIPTSGTSEEEEEASLNIATDTQERRQKSLDKMREKLHAGKLEKRTVEITVEDRAIPMVEVFSNAGIEPVGMEIQSMLDKITPSRQTVKKVAVEKAREILLQQESEKLIDKDKVVKEGLEWAENMGIIFIDEIDKVVGSDYKSGPDVSREGVQRDLLPIVEGCSVVTRYGMARSDHVLFIAAGAFTTSKPSDLIPELQGRFPIRVELQLLTKNDFVRILTEPKNALIKQYQALLKTEGVELNFEPGAIQEIAHICEMVNQRMQNIGARRLHTVMEKLLEEISFQAPEMEGQRVTITPKMVQEKLSNIAKDEDLSRYIL